MERTGCLGWLIALAIGAMSVLTFAPHCDRQVYEGVTVTEKAVKRVRQSDKYLLFTKLNDGQTRVFENTDSLLEAKFNSSDVYAEIEVGTKYDLESYGWRIPFLSFYENILGAQPVQEPSKDGQEK